jgi:uncharacterized protein involved in type VI secretion and phage assembly
MPEKYLDDFFIKIGGKPLPKELYIKLAEVVVDTSLHLPSMFSIRFSDPELAWVDSDFIELGKPVEISAQTSEERGAMKGDLIKGEITAIEPDFSSEGDTALLIRGYDKSHRLHRGRKTRTFANQTDSKIVETVAKEAGLPVDIDATTIVHEYVLQNNQTNMEFLLARAERVGYQVHVIDGKFYFKKGDTKRADGPELALGDALKSFRPRMTSSHQANKVVVKGWNPKDKTPIVAEASQPQSLSQGGVNGTGGSMAQKAFGFAAEEVVVNQPIYSLDEAKALATGLSNDLSREFIQAEGVCEGDPRVKAGYSITIKGVGKRFSGKYFVTSATHIYNKGGYETTFIISGRHPTTLNALLSSGDGSPQSQGRIEGVVIGTVTNLNDKENLGRVKVKFPWLGDIESHWAKIATPMAGANRGFFYLPEIQDEVLIAFEHGDVHRPYIIGALWNNRDKPPATYSEVFDGSKVNRRILKSRSGHIITLDDTGGQEKIQIIDKSGKNSLVINTASNTVTVESGTGITLQSSNGGQKVVLDGQGQAVQLQGGGRMITLRNGQVQIT